MGIPLVRIQKIHRCRQYRLYQIDNLAVKENLSMVQFHVPKGNTSQAGAMATNNQNSLSKQKLRRKWQLVGCRKVLPGSEPCQDLGIQSHVPPRLKDSRLSDPNYVTSIVSSTHDCVALLPGITPEPVGTTGCRRSTSDRGRRRPGHSSCRNQSLLC